MQSFNSFSGANWHSSFDELIKPFFGLIIHRLNSKNTFIFQYIRENYLCFFSPIERTYKSNLDNENALILFNTLKIRYDNKFEIKFFHNVLKTMRIFFLNFQQYFNFYTFDDLLPGIYDFNKFWF